MGRDAVGIILLFAWGGHLLLFTLPSLVLLFGVVGSRKRHPAPGPPFWSIALLSAVAFTLFRLAYLLHPYRAQGWAGIWEVHIRSLYNLPLAAAYLLAGGLLLWARLSVRHRPLARALLAGVLISLAVQLPATFCSPGLYPRLGVELHN